jgi:hypothetical protein
MKKCTYCGKEYPDEAEVCAIDHEPLERVGVSFRQRLIEANLHDDFVVAAQKRNQQQMIALLVKIGKKKRTAAFIVHAILISQKRYV